MAGSCENGNETSGSIKGREFFDKLNSLFEVLNDSVPPSCLVGNNYLVSK
jgi:hypothetical protein